MSRVPATATLVATFICAIRSIIFSNIFLFLIQQIFSITTADAKNASIPYP